MKTNLQNLYILWSVLSVGISCAADSHASQFTRRKKGFKPQSKLIKLPATGVRTSPASTSQLSARPGKPRAMLQSEFAHLPDVSVTCSVADFVVRVKPSFYGLGADAEELTLGRSCKSNGVLRPYGDLLFTYPLTACDAVRELPHGYLVYKFVLHYEPSQRFPGRARRIDVDIECRYQRDHHVHQLAVKPTWQTAVLRKRLKGRPSDFQLDLMDDSWREPAKSQVYHLGKTVNFQVSASHLRKRAKLYINSCYATPSSGSKPFLKYTIIDNLGCMMDSKTDLGASQFVSRTNKTIRFSVKTFQFTADPDAEISIHCKLSVTSEDPDPGHKSCTYKRNGWTALAGDDSICDCCDSHCVTSKRRRAVFEGSASIGLLVSDQSPISEDVSIGTEEEIRISHHNDELHSWKNLWEFMDVVKNGGGDDRVEVDKGSRVIDPGLGFGDWSLQEEWDATGVSSEEIGNHEPRHEVEDFMESEEQDKRSEGNEAEQGTRLNRDMVGEVAALEHLNAGTRAELQPHKAKEQEENFRYTVKDKEDESMEVSEEQRKNSDLPDVADEGEMTWYFTWR